MSNFEAARVNMVEHQVRPSGVPDRRIMNAMLAVPRELFVPKSKRAIAYAEDHIEVAPGRYLVDPMVFARMLYAAEISPQDLVLDLGCTTGYSTAIIGRLADAVVALESDDGLAARAGDRLVELGVDNAAVVVGNLEEGYADEGPYDVIFINGSVDYVPEALGRQLGEGGRLVTVLDENGVGRITRFVKGDGTISKFVVRDGSAPRLPGFTLEKRFAF